MFLVRTDKRVPDLVRERVEALCSQAEQLCDYATLVDRVLSEPDVLALIERLWDDESGKAVYAAVVDDIRQEVLRCLDEIRDPTGARGRPA